ncbi:MAG TPA: DUF2232 domain-containing protein [Candidatus Eisenbacteria bacterium]
MLGAALIALASSQLPLPVPWAYGLLPIGLFWLARRVGLLLGALGAASTLGAVYASGVKGDAPILFVAVLLASGLLLALAARRGLKPSTALLLAAAPVVAVALAYVYLGGMDDLTRVIADRIEEQRRLYQENQAFQAVRDALGLTAASFESGLELQRRAMELLLPSLFALQWLIVVAVNGWLASVLFEKEGGFPSFSRFVTWRVHPAGAWLLALALALVAIRVKAAFIAGVNLAFPLAVAYTIQGFAVARFVALALEVRGVVQAGVILLLVLMPVLVLAVTTVGLLDAWYDFRTMLITGSRPSRSDEGGGD